MIKYCAKVNNANIYKVDFEKEEFESVGYFSDIDYRYIIPEDGILEITDKNGNKKSIEVKQYDMILKMYSTTGDYDDKEFIVIDNPELKDYYRRRIERLEADRKARKVTTEERCCCDCEPVEAA
ncbi:hypothetical protein OJM15_gp73 [uncultured phage cr16_1]|uniref:Uncharacterized protein n=1 Tax=uncultured phage cr16_1 TaxID=2986414 RepID=A0AAE7RYH5_9CAUD|nr:hypothetical protein OJM15_gp73 [uncultured phage cr16_1]QWM91247.1 hypothetical protein [uncultured phage cr16_1]DAU07209.1 MAG TPA: hypothetical protein [Caudoviricetes sp.]